MKLKRALLAATLCLGCAASGQAATTLDAQDYVGLYAGNVGAGASGDRVDLAFSWLEGGYGAYVSFSLERMSRVFLKSFLGTNAEGGTPSNTRSAGVILSALDAPDGAELARLSAGGDCSAAAGPIGGACTIIAKRGTGAGIEPSTATPLYANLGPGSYRLGLFAFEPVLLDEVESVELVVTAAPVPLPAGGALVLTGLAGLALARRRRNRG
jgi:hypothetical protein